VQVQTNAVRLSWTTVGGKRYAVQTNASLDSTFADFSPVITMPGAVESSTNYLDAGSTTNNASRFYRIRVVP
jgi:hypothetical protein